MYLQPSWGFRTRFCCSLIILIWLVSALIQCLISFVSLLDLQNMLSECINEMYQLLNLSTLEYYSFLSSFGTSQIKNLIVHFYYSYNLKMFLASRNSIPTVQWLKHMVILINFEWQKVQRLIQQLNHVCHLWFSGLFPRDCQRLLQTPQSHITVFKGKGGKKTRKGPSLSFN